MKKRRGEKLQDKKRKSIKRGNKISSKESSFTEVRPFFKRESLLFYSILFYKEV